MTEYEVYKGETVTLPFVVTEGDVNDVDSVEANLRRLSSNGTEYGEEPIELEVQDRAAQGEIPAGWNILVSEALSLDLKRSNYKLEIWVEMGSSRDMLSLATLSVK
jgi:hypothetical protein